MDPNLQAVQQKSEKIMDEEVKCKAMAELALADLSAAMPALEEAMRVTALVNAIIQTFPPSSLPLFKL